MINKKPFLKNCIELFSISHLDKHEWHMFKSPRRFLAVIWYIVFVKFLFFSLKNLVLNNYILKKGEFGRFEQFF